MFRTLCLAALAVVFVTVPQATRADILRYDAFLDGPSESPPNASPGTGFTVIDIDTTLNTMRVQVWFSGLLAPSTASHIHAATAIPGAGTAGVATTVPTFTGFPLGVTSGTYDHTFDMLSLSSYNPAYVTANGGTAATAEVALFASIAAGTSYLNIHSTVDPGGEIRGFLQSVPEPSSLALLGTGALGLFSFVRRQTRRSRGERGLDPATSPRQ
jgi:hypothetical protein